MLQKVLIKDNTNLPLSYAKKIKAFKTGTEYNFKPGINIIVGPNGSGKSTLINMLRLFFWCSSSMESKFPDGLDMMDQDRLFNDDNSLRDGIEIKSDYSLKVFSLKPYKDFKRDNGFSNFSNFSLMASSMRASVGEGTLLSLKALFNLIFNKEQDYKFVALEIKNEINHINDLWKTRFTNLYEYYKKNQIKPKENEVTILLDEPDRNLDILNIDDVYGILSFHKPQTQIIASIHNPILIYKLSKNKDINFIELETGYFDKVREIIKNL